MSETLSALRKRFEPKVDSSAEHHLWTAARDPVRRTGRAKHLRKDITAHRLGWELFVGPVPAGARVTACRDEPACVRVEHLRLDGRAMARSLIPASDAEGRGSIAEVSEGVFKLTVTSGSHPDGRQRRVVRTVESSKP